MGQVDTLVRWIFFFHDLLSIDQPGRFDISRASVQRNNIAADLPLSASTLGTTLDLLRPRLSAKRAIDFIDVVSQQN
jgi:hypothetical protein